MIQLVDGLIFGRQEALHCLLSAKTLAPPNGVTCRGMEGVSVARMPLVEQHACHRAVSGRLHTDVLRW
jgi:hypothetical protein